MNPNGAIRKPTALIALHGGKPDVVRKREKNGEPKPAEPLGDPPARFTESQRAAWKEIADQAFWLTAADRFAVEMLALLLASFRRIGVEEFNAAKLGRMESLFARLGLTPSDRSKIKTNGDGKKEGNPFNKHSRA